MPLFGPPDVARLESERKIPALIRALSSKTWDTRLEAAAALGRVGDLAAVPPLVIAMHDDSSQVGSASATALGRIGGDVAVSALIAALVEDPPDVRQAATRALAHAGPDAIPALISALRDPRFRARAAAAESLGLTGDQRCVPLLTPWLKDGDADVRTATAAALYQLGAPQPIASFSGPFAHRLERRLFGPGGPDETPFESDDLLDQNCDPESEARFDAHQTALREILDERTLALSEYLMPQVRPSAVRTPKAGPWPWSITRVLAQGKSPGDDLSSLPGLTVWRQDSSHLKVVCAPRLIFAVGELGIRRSIVVIATKTIDNSDYVRLAEHRPWDIAPLLRADRGRRERNESFKVEFFTVPDQLGHPTDLRGVTFDGRVAARAIPTVASTTWMSKRLSVRSTWFLRIP
jgi:HEAT repeat protein